MIKMASMTTSSHPRGQDDQSRVRWGRGEGKVING